MKTARCLALLLAPLTLLAFEGYMPTEEREKPWFTGPLLSTSGNITDWGHWNIQPYISAFARTSFYNQKWKSDPIETLWTLQFKVPVWIGIAPRVDLKITPLWDWNKRRGQTHWTMGDWIAQINIQLFRDRLPSDTWLPSMKISIRETFPTGKYRHLDPKKQGTDSNGFGSWTTAISLNTSKLFHFHKFHFLNLYLDFLCAIPTSVHVEGFNAYGGGYGTKGTVKPDTSFQIFFAFEYSFTQNWAIACDFLGIWSSKIQFSGNPGIAPIDDQNIAPSGLPAIDERKAAIQYSVAPAIEYNWSEDLGLIAGAWLTIAGKNSPHFTSGIVSLNYYH